MAIRTHLVRFSSSSPTAVDAQLNTYFASNAYQFVDVSYRITPKGDRTALISLNDGTAATIKAIEFTRNSSDQGHTSLGQKIQNWLDQHEAGASSTITLQEACYEIDENGAEWALLIYTEASATSTEYWATTSGPDYDPIGDTVKNILNNVTPQTPTATIVKHALDANGRYRTLVIHND